MSDSPYQELTKLVGDAATLGSVGAVLRWDEETYMPPAANAHRAEQVSLVSTLAHKMSTSPKIGELLSKVEASDAAKFDRGDDAVAANVREMRRDYDRATKLPESLVAEMSKTAVLSQHAWTEARKNDTFETFKPWLEKTMDLQRQVAACTRKPGQSDYDALLDQYETGETAANLKEVFGGLRKDLAALIQKVQGSSKRPDTKVLDRQFPHDAQHALGKVAAAKIGYDFNAGRLDTVTHPFCTDLGVGDVRITTRYLDDDMRDGFFGTLHEAGHAMYEQGLPADHYGTPLGEAVSLGIHESQSRMWENNVGRSSSFWTHFMPILQKHLPVMKDVSQEAFVAAVNAFEPSFIRTDSDEGTYNLHIMLRFEIEQKLLDGSLAVGDLPEAWNATFKDMLGLDVPDNKHGCLQDVHWSFGAVGYFPTYTLGNLYAAQMFEAIREQLGDVDAMFAKGEFQPLLDWLRTNVHQHGRRYKPRELCEKATGKPLTPEPLLRHLRAKAEMYYGV